MKLSKGRGRCLSVCVGAWLGLGSLAGAVPVAPGWAADRLPANTEIYLEVRPSAPVPPGFGARLARSPLHRVLVSLAQTLKLPPQPAGLAAAFDGRAVLAVTRAGDVSFAEGLARAEARSTHRQELQLAVDSAWVGVNDFRRLKKRFPQDVADLVKAGTYSPTLTPAGARLTLKRDGRRMSVEADWQPEGEPTLHLTRPDSGVAAEAAPEPPWGGLLLAAGVSDESAVRSALATQDAASEEMQPEGDGWCLKMDGETLHLQVRSGWLTVGNQPELTQQFLASGSATSGGLSGNPRFTEQGRRWPADAEVHGFVDLQDVLSTSPGLLTRMHLKPETLLVRSLGGSAGRSLSNAPEPHLSLASQVFLQWDGVHNVPTGAAQPGARIPLATETVAWADLGATIRLWDRFSSELGLGDDLLNSALAELSERLGVVLTREALAAGAGAYAYSEAIDALALEAEALLGYARVLEPEAEKAQEGASFGASRLPVLVVLETTRRDLWSALGEAFRSRLGAAAEGRKLDGQEFQVAAGGRWAYAQRPAAQVWSGGYTDRLMPRVLHALDGTTPTLAAMPSYNRFMAERQGELVIYAHRKVDREGSLLKALLLELGSDFRPEAELAGRLRDSHMALETVPGGLSWRSRIESAEPPAPSPLRVKDEKEKDRD